ncbi:hypothetical protein D3C83_103040 [compost metagenome]
MSAEEIDVLNRRVRELEHRENENLTFLRGEMARVRTALDSLSQAAHRSRMVRQGYGGMTLRKHLSAGSNLGCA